MGLSASLARLGLALGRFKTGTPCRLDARTVDTAGYELHLLAAHLANDSAAT